jgi:hypothetical protein
MDVTISTYEPKLEQLLDWSFLLVVVVVLLLLLVVLQLKGLE